MTVERLYGDKKFLFLQYIAVFILCASMTVLYTVKVLVKGKKSSATVTLGLYF